MEGIPIRRGPYDQIGMTELNKVKEWDADKEAQALFQAQFREFIETKPLYSNLKITLPPGRLQFFLKSLDSIVGSVKLPNPFAVQR
jgi:hypothetical protein